MRHSFDTADTLRFLNPKAFYVGATFDACQLSKFIKESIWEYGYYDSDHTSIKTDKYEEYVADITKGDTLIVKRLNGKAQTTMRILAIGIVLGRNFDKTIRVAWVKQLDIDVPLHTVGTISPGYRLTELPDAIKKEVEKARAKFLRLNLQIEDQWY